MDAKTIKMLTILVAAVIAFNLAFHVYTFVTTYTESVGQGCPRKLMPSAMVTIHGEITVKVNGETIYSGSNAPTKNMYRLIANLFPTGTLLMTTTGTQADPFTKWQGVTIYVSGQEPPADIENAYILPDDAKPLKTEVGYIENTTHSIIEVTAGEMSVDWSMVLKSAYLVLSDGTNEYVLAIAPLPDINVTAGSDIYISWRIIFKRFLPAFPAAPTLDATMLWRAIAKSIFKAQNVPMDSNYCLAPDGGVASNFCNIFSRESPTRISYTTTCTICEPITSPLQNVGPISKNLNAKYDDTINELVVYDIVIKGDGTLIGYCLFNYGHVSTFYRYTPALCVRYFSVEEGNYPLFVGIRFVFGSG